MFFLRWIGGIIRTIVCLFIVAVMALTWVWHEYESFQANHPLLAKILPGSYDDGCEPVPAQVPQPDVWAAQFAGHLLHDVAYAKPPTTEQIVTTVQSGMEHTGYLAGVLWGAAKGGSVDIPTKPLGGTQDPATGVGYCTCGSTDPRTPDQQTVNASAQLPAAFTAAQQAVARAAVEVANARGIPEFGKVIILAAGGRESEWTNLDHGPDGSVGWLQLIPANGTIAQRMNPTYSANWFFDYLVKVPNWQQMTVTQAAQAVQRSAYPNAYAPYESRARQLLALVDTGSVTTTPTESCSSSPEDPSDPGDGGSTSTPASWDTNGNPRTVQQALDWYAQQVKANTWIPVNTCEQQVNHAFGWYVPAGLANPRDHWAKLPESVRHPGSSTAPPAGALVYWDTGYYSNGKRKPGHIAVSAGQRNGVTYVYSSDAPTNHFGLVPISRIDGWGTRIGWSAPVFPGHNRMSDIPALNVVPFPVLPPARPVDPLTDPNRWKVAA